MDWDKDSLLGKDKAVNTSKAKQRIHLLHRIHFLLQRNKEFISRQMFNYFQERKGRHSKLFLGRQTSSLWMCHATPTPCTVTHKPPSLPQLVLLSMKLYGKVHPLGQFGSAVFVLSPSRSLCFSSHLNERAT